MRDTVPSSLFATQTAPSPNAIPAGPRPTGIVRVEPDEVSIRVTVPSASFVTQTAPSPAATPWGRWLTLIGLTTPMVRGLTWETVLSPWFGIQT